jgi:predicted dehydrogenase
MSRRRARLAVLGLGRMGGLHAHNLAGRVPSAELVGVVDAVEAVARRAGERYGVVWSTSAERIASDAAVDGLVIAAPTHLHAELVELAATAGRHVFCEKPVAFELDSARRAVAAVRAAGVRMQVGFQRRFDPDWIALREAQESGQLGDLRLFRCSHRNPRPPEVSSPLGDIFVDVAIHDFDAARWLGGEIVDVLAVPGRREAAVLLRFQSGAIGLVDVSRAVGYGFECSAELVGSRATVRIGGGHRPARVELLRDGRVSAPLARDHSERHGAAYVRELDRFGELVMGRDVAVPTGDDAVAALELALRASRPTQAATAVTESCR